MVQRGRGLAVEKRQAPAIEVTMAGMTPPPRSKEGTHTGRISHVRNTETPTKSSSAWWWAGRPTVRNAETFGGNRMSNKQMPVGESQQETGSRLWAGCGPLLQVASDRITGRIPDERGPGPKGRRRGQVSL